MRTGDLSGGTSSISITRPRVVGGRASDAGDARAAAA
jgi:hypothetical protein